MPRVNPFKAKPDPDYNAEEMLSQMHEDWIEPPPLAPSRKILSQKTLDRLAEEHPLLHFTVERNGLRVQHPICSATQRYPGDEIEADVVAWCKEHEKTCKHLQGG